MRVETMTHLHNMSARELSALTEPLVITYQAEGVRKQIAVLVPYKLFVEMQKKISGMEPN
jgi:hypothetical protein